MNICGKRMYSLLEKLNFERLSTFEGETKAAEILMVLFNVGVRNRLLQMRAVGIHPCQN